MRSDRTTIRRWAAAAAVLLAAFTSGTAQARGRVSVDLNFGLPFYAPPLAGVGIGIGIGVGYGRGYGHGHRGHGHRGYGHRGHGWAPGVVIAAPLIGYGVGYGVGYGAGYAGPIYQQPAPPVVLADRGPASVPANRPDPVIYPRNGQDGQQTEYDRQQCNRWATTQQAALADASVFQRAVEACMDGRGYSMR